MKLLAGLLLITATVPATAASVAPLCTSARRSCVERTVDAYFAGLLKADASAVPFAENVRATEQDIVAVTKRETFLAEFKASGAIKGLRNIRMYTDERSGDATVFLLVDVRAIDGAAPFTVRRAQRFRVEHGLITQVEIINSTSANASALWPD